MTFELIEDESLPVPDDSNRRLETIASKLEDPFYAVAVHRIVLPFSMIVVSPEGGAEIDAKLSVSIELTINTRTVTEGDVTKYWLDGASAEVIGTVYDSYEIKTGVAS